jgi:hypothetical protein
MSNKILSYKGLLADGAQERILLSTMKGEKGYRITKFQLLGYDAGITAQESTVKIYKDEQASITSPIDFSDNRLLGAGFWSSHNLSHTYSEDLSVIFDNEIFNQDIFITHVETIAALAVNYYIELEVMSLNETEATVATLKDIRNNA